MERDRQNISKVIFAAVVHAVIMSLLLALSVSAFTKQALAKDFGIVGHNYEVSEEDIIAYIKSKLSTLDLSALQEEMQDKVRSSTTRPKPVIDIKKAQENKEYYYDPTYVLDRSIYDHNGSLMHPVGTKVNPLSKLPLSNALIFIEGDDQEQVAYALEQYKGLDKKAKIILTSGSPIELQKAHKVWIYFDQFGSLTTKLGIKHVPAILTQDGLKLKISEVALS